MLTLIKNEEMIALDLQHRSMAILRVVGDRLELSEEYTALNEKIDDMDRRILSCLSDAQIQAWRLRGGHISNITSIKIMIARYDHLLELKALLKQIGAEIDSMVEQNQVG